MDFYLPAEYGPELVCSFIEVAVERATEIGEIQPPILIAGERHGGTPDNSFLEMCRFSIDVELLPENDFVPETDRLRLTIQSPDLRFWREKAIAIQYHIWRPDSPGVQYQIEFLRIDEGWQIVDCWYDVVLGQRIQSDCISESERASLPEYFRQDLIRSIFNASWVGSTVNKPTEG